MTYFAMGQVALLLLAFFGLFSLVKKKTGNAGPCYRCDGTGEGFEIKRENMNEGGSMGAKGSLIEMFPDPEGRRKKVWKDVRPR